MLRICLFILTNLAVMVLVGIILTVLGIQPGSVQQLMVVAGVFGFGGAFISLLLSKTLALRSVGGQLIESPRNEDERWLLQTVSSLAQRAQINMPQVAIYDAPDINAFATGARRNASLVAVSTGLLTSMTRSEAEAVLAHEVSHISNGDMITMTLLQGIVNTFVIFISHIVARILMSFLSGNRDSAEAGNDTSDWLFYSLLRNVLSIVFCAFASLITMWFSRRREFYADAGSAKLVGKEKMIAALQRLKTSYEPEESQSVLAFCINGRSTKFTELFMSHPPLDKRINALRKGVYL